MIKPSIQDLTKGEFNRYELVVGTAKCARMVTDEYVGQRAKAEKMIADHETDRSLAALIDSEYRDQKAVKLAINRMMDGRFVMMHSEEEQKALEELKEAEQ